MTQKALSLSVLQILAISCELRFSYICNVICLLAIQPFPLISSINVENRGVWGLWSNSEIPDSCHLLRSLRLEAVIPPQATKSWLLPDRDRPSALAMAGCPHCPQGDSGVTVTEVSPGCSSPSRPYVRTYRVYDIYWPTSSDTKEQQRRISVVTTASRQLNLLLLKHNR